MPKALSISSMIIAVVMLLLFGLDLLLKFPFNQASVFLDILFVICAGILGYMSWSTLREQV